ncbi:MAG: radical SAM protein [Candidatus Micrarchaeia archaeon]
MNAMGLFTEGIKSNFVSLSHPYKLTFAITMRCNSRCRHCNIWQLRPQNELTIEEIRKFSEANPFFKIVELTGGEPFLRGDIVEIAEAFSKNSKGLYAITMPTNSLVSKDLILSKVKGMLKLKQKIVVTLSLDGYRELEDHIRGVSGNYDKVISLYKEFSELKKSHKNFDFKLGYTIIGLNQGKFLKTVEEVKKDLPEVSITDFHVNIGATSESYYGNNRDLSSNIVADKKVAIEELKEVAKAYKKSIGLNIFDIVNVGEYIYLKGLIEYLEKGVNPFKRRIGEASVFVDNVGNVYPSILVEKKLGNIRSDGYALENIISRSKNIIKEDNGKHYTFCDEEASIIGDIPKSLELLIK